MPTYEYACKKCENQFEVWQSANDEPIKRCVVKGCRGTVQKVFGPVGIIFKGSGWHITDYSRNGNGGESKSETAEKTEKTEKAEKKKDEAVATAKTSTEE